MPIKQKKTLEQFPVQIQDIVESLKNNYMPYAMSVIVSRAIPEIDGFKPAHRKLLYTMYRMGLLEKPRTKCANIVGQTMRLNPHGDASIYETLVRLTKNNESLLLPFIDSKGNFGKVYARDMAYAASRYTEAKLEPVCEEVFTGISQNAVDFVDNYDGTMQEPSLLPTSFPNILVNPNIGIAVGMASSICSFNLKEVCETTIAYLKNKNHDIRTTLPAPDFPTGGKIVLNEEEFDQIYQTGRGSFVLQAKWAFCKNTNTIEILEIPYTTTIEAIIDKISAAIKDGKITEILDVRDESDLSGLKIAIEIRKGTNIDKLMQKLYQTTPLQDSFNCNFNILIDGRPQTIGIKTILDRWIDWRIAVKKKVLSFELKKMQQKSHLFDGLSKILLDIDRAIQIIRQSKKDQDVIPRLMNAFQIDQSQAEFIAEIKLRNINEGYILAQIKAKEKLKKEITRLQKILTDDRYIQSLIAKELTSVADKYGTERKSEIIAESTIKNVDEKEPTYKTTILISKDGYVKNQTSFKKDSIQLWKQSDGTALVLSANSADELWCFSTIGQLYKISISTIPIKSAKENGEFLPNLLQMDPNEKLLFTILVPQNSAFILYGYSIGKIAKIPISIYQTKSNRRKLKHVFAKKEPPIAIFALNGTEKIGVTSNIKKRTVSADDIPATQSKTSMGKAFVRLQKNEYIQNFSVKK